MWRATVMTNQVQLASRMLRVTSYDNTAHENNAIYTRRYVQIQTGCVRERLELSCKHACELVCDSQNDEPENSTEERLKSAEKSIQFRNG